MSEAGYVVRKMTREEVPFAVRMAEQEGWNPGVHDAECFYSADPNGFLIGLLDGEPVSSLSVVKYGANFGFLGLYIVKPDHRGKGYGLTIWNEGMKYLANCTVGLDGVLEQEDDYRRSGFVTRYCSSRYEGQAPGGGCSARDTRVVRLAEVPFHELQVYDESLFQRPRADFLRCWINQPESVALGFMQDGKLSGYTVLRRCVKGYKIGPLFADNETIAEALCSQVVCQVAAGSMIYLDVPGEEQNPAATALARRHGMTRVFQTARMYRMRSGDELNLPLDRWYGVTSFELG